MKILTPAQQQALRARAHTLSPVVIISGKGLSDSVLKEIDLSLKSHELIKVRIVGDDRDQRTVLMETICAQLEAALVQQVGKVLVLYRENPEKIKAPKKVVSPRPKRTSRAIAKPTRKKIFVRSARKENE
ncbi:MAG TPA: ribosome assembly RNA-binding protein YhbY [Burkholderiales bacterium]|jgi:putative YhbY family RNA-binding protein|nr:ribosome assembly RNA-binding protein YhbY [Burkholderiales bacterium]